MDYICYKRFTGLAIFGKADIHYGKSLRDENGMLYLGEGEEHPVCWKWSQNAYEHFCRNDDGLGKKRGKLIFHIKNKLQKRDKNHQLRWDKLWADEVAKRLKRQDRDDFWCWSFAFYNAEVDELEHIWRLIKDV